MSFLTGAQAQPQVQMAPLPPTQNQPDIAAQQAAAMNQERAASAGGQASNILTSPLGDTSTPKTAAATLLGN